MIRSEGLAVGYPVLGDGSRSGTVASRLDVELRPGELVCLLGPNGAGKSTLLRTLAGLQRPLEGKLLLDNSEIGSIPPRLRARKLAVVLTDREAPGMLTALELVRLGRYPHTDWAGRLRAADHRAVDEALAAAGATDLAARLVAELSDGERQKVMIARALAQEPTVLLLDEATAFLDLPRRVELMRLLREQAWAGKAVLLSTHDLDLALRSADRLWLLSQDGELRFGLPEELVLSGAFGSTFDAEGVVFDPAEGAFQVGATGRGSLNVEGPEGKIKVWTVRAVQRLGFAISRNGEQAAITVRINATGKNTEWILDSKSGQEILTSLEELVERLQLNPRPYRGTLPAD